MFKVVQSLYRNVMDATTDDDNATIRTLIHDVTLSVYDPSTVPSFEEFQAIDDFSADSVAVASGVDT